MSDPILIEPSDVIGFRLKGTQKTYYLTGGYCYLLAAEEQEKREKRENAKEHKGHKGEKQTTERSTLNFLLDI